MVGRRGSGRGAAGGWLTVLLTVLVLALSGCQLPGGGGASDVSQYFEDEAAQELAQAVADGDRSAIRDAVEGGTSVGTTGTEGLTMLQLAIDQDRYGSLLTLLELGADPDQVGHRGDAALHTAARADSPRFLEALLEAGADPDVRQATTQVTPLIKAAGGFSTEHFQLLLDAGADISLADRSGITALHQAAILNEGSQVLTLLERGADPTVTDRTGATFQDYLWTTDADLMHGAALREREKIAEWLTARDIPVHEKADWTRDGA